MGAGRMGADWFWHIHGTWFGESQRGVGRGGGVRHRAQSKEVGKQWFLECLSEASIWKS